MIKIVRMKPWGGNFWQYKDGGKIVWRGVAEFIWDNGHLDYMVLHDLINFVERRNMVYNRESGWWEVRGS